MSHWTMPCENVGFMYPQKVSTHDSLSWVDTFCHRSVLYLSKNHFSLGFTGLLYNIDFIDP